MVDINNLRVNDSVILNQNEVNNNTSKILQKYYVFSQKIELLNEAQKDILHNLAYYGINFENKSLPISLMPQALQKSDVDSVIPSALAIRSLLNKIIDLFIEEHNRQLLDGPLHRFFAPYYRWWDLIASEQRSIEHIQLPHLILPWVENLHCEHHTPPIFRIDFIINKEGEPKICELNIDSSVGGAEISRAKHIIENKSFYTTYDKKWMALLGRGLWSEPLRTTQ